MEKEQTTATDVRYFWIVKFKVRQRFAVRKLLDEDFAKSINWRAKTNNVKIIFNENGEEYFCFDTQDEQKTFVKDIRTLCSLRGIPLRFFGSDQAVPIEMTRDDAKEGAK